MILLKKNVCKSALYFSFLIFFLNAQLARAQWVSLGDTTGISTGPSSYGSLVTASSDHFYLSYQDSILNKAVVLKYDGTAWSYIGDSTGITSGSTMYNSMAVNDSGMVFHAFQDLTQGNKLSIGQYYNSSTSITNNLSASGAYFTRITCDQTGKPYTTYRDISLNGCFVTKRLDGTSWSTVGLAGFAPLISYYPSVVIGSNDTMYVSFVTALSALSVMKIHKDAATGTAWQSVGSSISTVGSHSIFKNLSAMCIDSSNRLYLAYVSTSNKLCVKRYEGGAWTDLGSPDFSAGLVSSVSLAVTPAGTPYIAFGDATNNNKLVVMTYNGTQWFALGNNALSAGSVYYTALSVDNSGLPVVAFGDGGENGKTKVMRYLQGVDSVTVETLNNVQPQININGGTLQLVASVFPAVVNQQVTWSITNVTGEALISASGLVSAEENGIVLAKVVSVADTTKYATIEISIINQVVQIDSVKVTTQANAVPAINTLAGTLQLLAEVFPASANQGVTWSITPETGSAIISNTGLVTATTNGTVWAKAISNAAPTYTDSIKIVITNQQVNAISELECILGFSAYPNPARNVLNIHIRTAHPQVLIEIMEMNGKVLMSKKAPANALNTPMTLELNRLASGIYMLQVKGEGLSISNKFFKK
ncbi:MAG: T9SS type A sorting domain-containing protein [Taibaiella sp.]|jgi:hypothetical protein